MSRSGEYRHPVTVQRLKASATRDTFNHLNQEDAASWETYVARRAKIVSNPGKELFVGDQVQSQITHVVSVRRDAVTMSITTGMRIVMDGQYYNIESISPFGPKRNEVILGCLQLT